MPVTSQRRRELPGSLLITHKPPRSCAPALCTVCRRKAYVDAISQLINYREVPFVFVKTEDMKGAVEPGLEVAQYSFEPAKLRRALNGEDCFVVAVRCGHGAEAVQAT